MKLPSIPPRWDLSVVYPSLQSSEFEAGSAEILRLLGDLEALFESRAVRKGSPVDTEGFEAVVDAYNGFTEKLRTHSAFISAYVTTDSRDSYALAKESELDSVMVRVQKLSSRMTAWIGGADVDQLKALSNVARNHAYWLDRAKVAASHQMSPDEEMLAADLSTTGSTAWEKLHSNVSSQLVVALEIDDEPQTLPVSAVRSLAYDARREVRRAAFEAELSAWKSVEIPLASAMNSIKGETLTLMKRRGWDHPLDAALFSASIDRDTLDAMLQAAKESFPEFRRYLNAKARALGISKLGFYDIFAPVGGTSRSWEYGEATTFVEEQFRSYSAKMGDFAARSFRENWIDAESRPGKVDGAYCMGLRNDESRILMNFTPSYGSVSTLAHELGHGYHNLCLHGRTSLQHSTPMTLAETASIFCETIVKNASLALATPAEQLTILEASLQGSCQVVVDITSRFLFESSVFELRAKRELSAQEMCERMAQAQLDTYGDGLDPELLHPYMWAAKPHYYGTSYYNFPYMFGLLFGLGLYAIYQKEGASFRDRYDSLLSSTGMADAATLAGQFGIEIRTPDFWRGSLAQIKSDIDRFEQLV